MMPSRNSSVTETLLIKRRFFSALVVWILLKNQVHGAFTQRVGGSTSSHKSILHPAAAAAAATSSSQSHFSTTSLFVKGGSIHSKKNVQPVRFWEKFRGKPRSNMALGGSTAAASDTGGGTKEPKKYNHVLAILAMPATSMDRIANEAVLKEALQHVDRKLSIVLHVQGGSPSLASLRRYVGEVYSQLWDFSMASEDAIHFNDVVVYPQNLPNSAAESWIYHRPDLDAICSHDSICGWISSEAQGRGTQFQYLEGDGVGGLKMHVSAVNADRSERNLKPAKALHVANWPIGASSTQLSQENVIFVDDDVALEEAPPALDEEDNCSLLGGARINAKCLYNCVAVGGTFDGLHYGHRKLLTLAVSSVTPVTGKLMVGVTVDEMLQSKQFAEYIPSLEERMEGVREFLHRLAPGMKNRIIISPISDAYGPPGQVPEGSEFDALVLSHETLDNGVALNRYRTETLGFQPLTLLCTRRTEAYGMSSTTLRRLRSMSKVDDVTANRI